MFDHLRRTSLDSFPWMDLAVLIGCDDNKLSFVGFNLSEYRKAQDWTLFCAAAACGEHTQSNRQICINALEGVIGPNAFAVLQEVFGGEHQFADSDFQLLRIEPESWGFSIAPYVDKMCYFRREKNIILAGLSYD